MNKNEIYSVFFITCLGVAGVVTLLHHTLNNLPIHPAPEKSITVSVGTDDSGSHGSSSSSSSAQKGEKLVKSNCAVCHGENGKGKIGIAPGIRNKSFLAIASDDFIEKTIRKGRPGTSMTARADLNAGQIKDVISYLRSLEIVLPLNIEVDDSKKYEGSSSKGEKMFATYCAPCHGENGGGYFGGGSAPGIGKSGFLDVASDDFIFQTVKHGRIGTAMKSFLGATGLANLSEQDIADIIVFLRSLNK